MWKDKLANYLIDISKYIITGVIVASIFKGIENKFFLYFVGGGASLTLLFLGLFMLKQNENGR